MRRTGLLFSGIALAALASSCSSDDPLDITGTGGSGTVGDGSGGPSTNVGGTDPGVGGTGNPNDGGATANVGGGASVGGGTSVDGGGGLSVVDPNAGGANANAGGTTGVGVGGVGQGAGGLISLPKPPLVVSGEGAYWQIKTEADLAPGTTATITVDSTATNKDWKGFGGTFNEQGWAALQALSPELRQEAMNLLFDANNGIGFDWGRIPMGPSDYAIERYTLSSGPGDFDITHDTGFLIPYILEAQKIKSDVKYWASPWTPPPWAKTGQYLSDDGYDKGIFNADHYQPYADYFVAWIQAYEAQGIPIDSVMPQNEPGWSQDYPTCAWGPSTDSATSSQSLPDTEPVTLGTFVDGYLFPTLAAASLPTEVWFGTLSNYDTFPFYWNDMMSKASAGQIRGVGLQWATQPRISEIRTERPDYIVMQSEHKCGNYPWLMKNKDKADESGRAASVDDANRDNFLPEMAPNNHAYGEESWDLMKSWIDDGVNIYSAWNMVLDTGGFNLDDKRKWPQNAMIVVDKAAGTMQITAYYYVFRHIAQYVDVDAVSLKVSGNALAFRNPDGSVMTAIFNEGTAPASTTLSVDGNMVTFEIPARGWATVNM